MADGAYEPFPPVEAWAAVPFDPALYDEQSSVLETARAEASDEARERAVRTAIRYAGTDTGAIEGLYTTDRGFTRTVAIEAAAWETAAKERGPNAVDLIKDQIAAYEWVLDLVTQKVPVTQHVVRELHAMLCRSQDTYVVHTSLGRQERPLPKGEYKTLPNNPTLASGRVYHYAPPEDVPAEMHRLVTTMQSSEYEAMHPIVQAAYVHYALAAIHPFVDGNGRTSRALASVPLYRDRRVPLMILAEDRDAYLDALGAADLGNLQAFVSFVHERTIDTLQLVVLTIRAAQRANGAKSLDALRRVVTAAGGRTHPEMDALAHRLLQAFEDEAAEYVETLDLPPGITVSFDRRLARSAAPNGYRAPVQPPHGLELLASSAPPAAAGAVVVVRPVVPTEDGQSLGLLVGDDHYAFELRDIDPSVRQLARAKLNALAMHTVSNLLDELAEKAEAALRRDGYLG